jgi:hypothetical protein
MQRLIVSMMRLSTAFTLYGLEQLESSMNLTKDGQDLNKLLDNLKLTLDSLSDVLLKNMAEEKKDTLKSITNMTEDVVKKSFDGMSFANPREVLKSTSDLIRQSSDTMAGWVGDLTAVDGEDPKPAAEVLS